MEKVLNVTYASSLTDLYSVNSSFDAGVLRIAYAGENRNRSAISHEAFENSIPTMFNCPIVCHYDRETDTLGGHDVEIVRGGDGSMRLVNMTVPVGVVPQNARHWWGTVTEADGSEREYLFCDALLWKRQEAYRKIKEDGITAQSMEITVKDGETKDGVFHIYDFEFTAFALIGVTPCFESAALELFSANEFKRQLSDMMSDMRESFKTVISSAEDDDTHAQDHDTEGGEGVLQEKTELAAKYGIQPESLDFSLDDYSLEELTEKFEAMRQSAQEAEAEVEQPENDAFALASNVLDELGRELGAEKVQREWGECERYWYVDCDLDANEIYCWDTNDWLLYGFTYSVNGDCIAIDFESKKRKKFVIADFEGVEQNAPFAGVFAAMEQRLIGASQAEANYQAASEALNAAVVELETLRAFKANAEAAEQEASRTAIFDRFADLEGVEAFERLREESAQYDADALEEKCYAIRGRNASQTAKFSLDERKPKVVVTREAPQDEPYGGLFAEYGIQ